MTVYIAGIGSTATGKHVDASVKSLAADAVRLALADAGLERNDVDAAWFCNTRQGILEGQHGIRGQVALRAAGFERLAIFNTDNACASSSSGLVQAFAAIKAGLYDVALVVGAEKMVYPDRRKEMFEAFLGSTDRDLMTAHLDRLLAAAEGVGPERTSGGEQSIFMEIYAAQARLHMKLFGTTERQIAAVAAKNHCHSEANPLAQYRFPMTIDEVLADRPVAWPLTRSMCAPMSDGAAALVLVSKARAARLGKSRAVRIMGLGVSSGSDRVPDDYRLHLTRTAAERCYAMAGVGPEDVSLAEIHDATAIAEIVQAEHLGLFAYGEAGPATEGGATKSGGEIPINLSGGLLSKGHPIGATGAMQIHELVTQLRGEAGKRQSGQPRICLAENGGGFHGVEEAACVVTLLEAPGRQIS